MFQINTVPHWRQNSHAPKKKSYTHLLHLFSHLFII
jgi:hypothetical protein